jgi:hypothetical protein
MMKIIRPGLFLALLALPALTGSAISQPRPYLGQRQ